MGHWLVGGAYFGIMRPSLKYGGPHLFPSFGNLVFDLLPSFLGIFTPRFHLRIG